jgi:oxalate decarboxylase/phosphoglucose isomerase-like protein (cupin superfamily)
MEEFCKIGKLKKERGYDVCRGVKRQDELRYDLTKIFPGRQTQGHYHLGDEPEFYEVQAGQAEFLMQDRKAKKTYLAKAEKNGKIIIPPGFSMRTINPSPNNELIISNWINNKVKNDYNAFKDIQKPINLRPKKIPKKLANLDFLSNPDKYKSLLTIKKLYKIAS